MLHIANYSCASIKCVTGRVNGVCSNSWTVALILVRIDHIQSFIYIKLKSNLPILSKTAHPNIFVYKLYNSVP